MLLALAILLGLLAAIATIAVFVVLFLLTVAFVAYEWHGGVNITDGVWVFAFGLVATPFIFTYAINVGLRIYDHMTGLRIAL